MALYLVVHHRQDKRKPWPNVWLDDDDDRLGSITTTAQIGRLCETAMIAGDRVFIHRCGWGAERPSICCSVKVAAVSKIDDRTSLVKFDEPVLLGCDPPRTPSRGQNFYQSEPVEIQAKLGS